MSTVKANDLQTTTGGIPTVKGQKLIPTAWVNFNGTGTVAIRDSENVSSIGDNGTGDYTVNFATNMANANYVMSGSVGSTDSTSGMWLGSGSNVGGFYNSDAVGSSRVQSLYSTSAKADTTHIQVMYLGGQA